MPTTEQANMDRTCERCAQSHFESVPVATRGIRECDDCAAHRCRECDDVSDTLHPDHRCDDCTGWHGPCGEPLREDRNGGSAPPPMCTAWSEEEHSDGLCDEHTTDVQCESCEEWQEDVLAPDNRCASCTEYRQCERCSGWEESLWEDNRCNDCTRLSHCANCDSQVESTDDNGYCDDCHEPDEDDNQNGNADEPNARDCERSSEYKCKAPPTNLVGLIGVELEGGWHEEPPDYENGYHHDGSVSARGEFCTGEIVSSPMSPQAWDAAATWIASNYPDRAGPSCGLHVHLSFGDRVRTKHIVALLRTDRFGELVEARLRAWGKRANIQNKSFWHRLDGKNTYCKRGISKGCRYHAVNFEAFEKHGTVEIRVLPMFYETRIAVRAIREVVRIVDRAASRLYRTAQSAQTVATVQHTAEVVQATARRTLPPIGPYAPLTGANLRGANLYGANLTGADLTGANLYGADLTGAALYGANLRGADLRSANLTNAALTGANLRGAALTGANLRGADLRGANLTGANLRGADLTGADLRGADLRSADLTGADLTGVDLTGVDLTGTIGLPSNLQPIGA